MARDRAVSCTSPRSLPDEPMTWPARFGVSSLTTQMRISRSATQKLAFRVRALEPHDFLGRDLRYSMRSCFSCSLSPSDLHLL